MPPPPSALVGWASVDGMGVATTTGGGTAAPIIVTTAAQLISNAAGATPRVIYVMGSLTGVFSIGSNKTVVGLCGASLHGHVSLSTASNVIVRNLAIVGNNCTDSPADCSGGADAVTIGNNSHHVWFDHDDVYDGSDGNLDITSGADFVTISWTKFRYTSLRTDALLGASGHRFSNLIGSADTVLTDAGHLNVTFHHDWWAENVNQRMPRTRFGKIHVFNNLFTSVGNSYCTNAGFMATVLVENNIYMGVQGPLQEDANGSMLARGNLMQGTTGGTAQSAATGPGFTPTYAYTLEDALAATSTLAATIRSQAGPQ